MCILVRDWWAWGKKPDFKFSFYSQEPIINLSYKLSEYLLIHDLGSSKFSIKLFALFVATEIYNT